MKFNITKRNSKRLHLQKMLSSGNRAAIGVCFLLALQMSSPSIALGEGQSIRNPLVESPIWQELRGDVLGEQQTVHSNGVFTLHAPHRATDPSNVPILLEQDENSKKLIKSAMIIVDENPSPVVSTFEFSEAMHPVKVEMMVRVNKYSNVRAIALADGGDNYIMDGRYVKASGGCSAPSITDPKIAAQSLGKMQLQPLQQAGLLPVSTASQAPISGARREAQLMIQHPNFSGLQRDQLTQLNIPAHFINEMEVYLGDELLFTMTGGISISENPVFRFAYRDNGATSFKVRAEDTEGNVFEQILPVNTHG